MIAAAPTARARCYAMCLELLPGDTIEPQAEENKLVGTGGRAHAVAAKRLLPGMAAADARVSVSRALLRSLRRIAGTDTN
mmetsp:Transcript_37820/g.95912  ORF Transcript_37820/g.95912 Transcript_37820/m.95912 type:complete len:80 (-) Transcript_37820:14-253(-)